MSPIGVGMSGRVSVCVRPPQRRLFARNLSGAAADKRVKKPRAAFSVQFVNFNCVFTAADDTGCRHLQLEPVYQLQQCKSKKNLRKNLGDGNCATEHVLDVDLDNKVSTTMAFFMRHILSSQKSYVSGC